MSRLGDQIKYFRTQQGLSQAKLAEKLGVSQTAIFYWESGSREPDIETIGKIENALTIPPGQLLTVGQRESRLLDEANWGLISVLKSVYDTVDLEWDQNLDCDGVPEPNGEFSVRLRKGKKVTYLTKQNWNTLFQFVQQNLPLFVGMATQEPPEDL